MHCRMLSSLLLSLTLLLQFAKMTAGGAAGAPGAEGEAVSSTARNAGLVLGPDMLG